ncbi:hypothetical protein Hanom_Chr09g00775901 [Helianthus anomalus]
MEVLRPDSAASVEDDSQISEDEGKDMKSHDGEDERPCTRLHGEEEFISNINGGGEHEVNGMFLIMWDLCCSLFKDKHKKLPKPTSPINLERPKKSSRSDLDRPIESFCFPANNVSLPNSNLDGNKEVKTQENNHGIDLHLEAYNKIDEGVCSSRDKLVDDPQERRKNKEVEQVELEETIRIGNLFGVNLAEHGKMIKETLGT